MPLRKFLRDFDFANPNWSLLPENFPNCDLGGLTSEEVGKFNSIITLRELSRPPRPKSRSRVWKHPQGYKYLVQWSNAVLLRYLLRQLNKTLPASEFRTKPQLNDAGRSQVRSIEEGWKRSTTSQYLDYLSFVQGSLEEVKGDIRDLAEDGFLQSKPGSSLAGIGINLKDFHEALKSSNSPLPSFSSPVKEFKGRLKEDKGVSFAFKSLEILYPPLKSIKGQDLTYEIFHELINKTDYLLRRLVESLERKLDSEQKAYQVEQARIRGNLRKK